MTGKWVISFQIPTNKYLASQGEGLTHYPEEALQFNSLEATLAYINGNREEVEALGKGARPGRIRD